MKRETIINSLQMVCLLGALYLTYRGAYDGATLSVAMIALGEIMSIRRTIERKD